MGSWFFEWNSCRPCGWLTLMSTLIGSGDPGAAILNFMKRDPLTGIGILEETLDYRDSSEDRVQQVLRAARDRSSTSDELASEIIDWPSRYHFSRTRAHLLAPLDVGPGDRVLDLGCGTGPITRALGEGGARVLGLEGNLDRARAAAIRCEGMEKVEILCGDVGRLGEREPFDIICCIGVLEYADSALGGGRGALALLENIRSRLAPGGTLLLAIENQLGLKYLLGYREDHVGLPWVGLEDYPVGFRARTWSRKALRELLQESGFPAQRWLFPYPDYKTPSLILSKDVFDLERGAEIADQLIRLPVEDYAFPRTMISDDRAVHRSFLSAGLGPDVANSFLVLASANEEALRGRCPPEKLAWHLGGERRSLFKRRHLLRSGESGLRMECHGLGKTGPRRRGWLEQHPDSMGPFIEGRSLEQEFLEACTRADEEMLVGILREWSDLLRAAADRSAGGARVMHPFTPRPSVPALPPDMVDLSLSNFIRPKEGARPVYIDREWVLEGGVDLYLAVLHALWFQALDLVRGGARHPWSEDLSVDNLCLKLVSAAGFEFGKADLRSFHPVEAEFQALVCDRDVEAVLRDLSSAGERTLATSGALCPFRWTDLPGKWLESAGC